MLKHFKKIFKPNFWYTCTFEWEFEKHPRILPIGKLQNPLKIDEKTIEKYPDSFEWISRHKVKVLGSVFLNPENWDWKIINKNRKIQGIKKATIQKIKTLQLLNQPEQEETIKMYREELQILEAGEIPDRLLNLGPPAEVKTEPTPEGKNFIKGMVKIALDKIKEKIKSQKEAELQMRIEKKQDFLEKKQSYIKQLRGVK